MNDLKSLFWAAALCFLTQAVHAEDATQGTLQKVIEVFNLASEPCILPVEKETGEGEKKYCHPYGLCGGGGGGTTGPTGPTGPMGPPGVGLPGPTGATGPAAAGAIIPYASGAEIQLSFDPAELSGVALGFSGISDVLIGGGQIDLNVGGADLAFSMPREGVITSLSADFSTSLLLDLSGVVTMTAQLYSSTTSDNIFIPVPGAAVTLSPALSGNPPIGTTISGRVTDLNIFVSAKTRLLMVYTITENPVVFGDSVSGLATAGLEIN